MNQVMDFLKYKPLLAGLWALGFVFCILCSVILMPAAELIPANGNDPAAVATLMPGLSPVRNVAAMDLFNGFGGTFADAWFRKGTNLENLTRETIDGAPGSCRAYILYSVGFAAAMIAAAIGIAAVGKLDSEEKTVIPVKK